MEVNKFFLAAILAAASTYPLCAQDGPLRGTVNVDGKYLPDVIRQDRINTLPRVYSFNLESSRLDYEQKGVTTPFAPSFLPLPALGWQTSREISDSKGYLDVNLGSWLNSSVSAGYSILDSRETDLSVWLQHNSTSLFKPHMSEEAKDVTRKRFDEVIGVRFSHAFSNVGRLSANFGYHLGYFNYYGYYSPQRPITGDLCVPTQTLNDISARLRWDNPVDNELRYNAAVGVRYFGYRRAYLSVPFEPIQSFRGEKETDVDISGGVSYAFDEKSSLGADLRLDFLGYDTPLWREETIDNYSNISLLPYYRFTRGQLDINIGAHLDFTFNAGPKGDRFSAFHLAPEVKFDFKSGPAGLYLHLLGGNRLNTLARAAQENYYGCPALLSTNPEYSPLDARLGINFGPFSGVKAGLSFAYKYTRHYQFPMLYMLYLNTPDMQADGYRADMLNGRGVDLKGWSIAANINYSLADIFSVGIEGSYQPQNGDKGYADGPDRPRWLLLTQASLRPIKPLMLTLQYRYRGVRNAYIPTVRISDIPGAHFSSDEFYGYRAFRLPDITDLSFRAAYDINKMFSVSLQADNILNRKVMYLPDVKTEGISIIGGVELRF